MTALKLDKPPFNLDGDALAWVERTRDGLSLDDKIGQLFVLMSRGTDAAEQDDLIAFQPGGFTRSHGPDIDFELDVVRRWHHESAVAPMVTTDLEGSRTSFAFGTPVLNNLGLAAVGDPEATAAMAAIMAREARAIGFNWSFTPCIDIAAAFRSAIVGTRSFGSDPDAIAAHARAYMRALQEGGIAATAKHWPGEGYDDRDQHLVTTVNPLSMDEWRQTYGRLYQALIDDGVMAVMPGHIALPAYVAQKLDNPGVEAFRPASVSRLLIEELLRGELGFNGLVVSDATGMAGLGSWMAPYASKPEIVAAGCDVILFSNDPQGDRIAVREAVDSGALSEERLDEAVTRILALKAALGLHGSEPAPADTARASIGRDQDRAAAAAVTAGAPTLVKDTQTLLPLDPARHQRVLVFSTGVVQPFVPEPLELALPAMLEGEGFEVTRFEPGMAVEPGNYDLMLYLSAEEDLLTRGHIFVDWLRLTGDPGGAMRRYWHEVPTAMISFGHPYLLYDAPRVPTYINAYSSLEAVQRAVLEALMGRAEFRGGNPVDPFCGDEQARF